MHFYSSYVALSITNPTSGPVSISGPTIAGFNPCGLCTTRALDLSPPSPPDQDDDTVEAKHCPSFLICQYKSVHGAQYFFMYFLPCARIIPQSTSSPSLKPGLTHLRIRFQVPIAVASEKAKSVVSNEKSELVEEPHVYDPRWQIYDAVDV